MMTGFTDASLLHRAKWTWASMFARAMRRWGAPGFLVAVLLVTATLLGTWAYKTWMKAEAEIALQQAQRKENLKRSNNTQNALPHASDAAQLASFQALLIAHDGLPQLVQSLIELAEKQGLRSAKGEYRMVAEPVGGFTRFRMLLPVKGDAASVQKFIAAALQSQPALALESVQFKRETIATPMVEARLQWVAFGQPSSTVGKSRAQLP